MHISLEDLGLFIVMGDKFHLLGVGRYILVGVIGSITLDEIFAMGDRFHLFRL